MKGTYNASKAALTTASETWRLELAPLGVRTLTVVAGGIGTNFFVNMQQVSLPETSLYQPIKDLLYTDPDHVPMVMKPEEFSRQLLHKIESGATGKVWIGGGVGMARAALWLMPQWMSVSW